MSRLIIYPVWLLLITLSQSCRSVPQGRFDQAKVPAIPDYSNPDNWAALPNREDEADALPTNSLVDRQEEAKVDVFFLHPTSYTGKPGDRNWNAATTNESVNKRTDEGAMRFQASIFNGVGRVFAPRYRQGHLNLYFNKDTISANAALDLAYQDVRNAFLYYWENYNQGRPLMIAAHSQGTNHAERLLREFFDGQERQQQLIAAYLVGMPIEQDAFESIPPCTGADQTGCFTSWRTFKRNYRPKKYPMGEHIVATNPLSWKLDDTYVPKSENLGAVLNPFEKIYPASSDAQTHQGILWASKPRFRGSILFNTKNYHIGDYNIYYMNVRENALERVETYLEDNNHTNTGQ